MRTSLALAVAGAIAVAACAHSSQRSYTALTPTRAFEAMARGDYREAAEILRARAEFTAEPDPIAEFYLATLYEDGRGVPADPVRACAFYLRSMTPRNPFRSQAQALAQHIQTRLGPPLAGTCALMASHGFRDALEPPSTFELSPGHSIEVSRTGVTIEYAGRQHRAFMDFGSPINGVLLEPRVTKLTAGRDGSQARHFLEFFAWIPTAAGSAHRWTLGWSVFEVVRDHLDLATGTADAARVDTVKPPQKFDVARAAHLSVNADGDVEWSMPDAPDRRTGTVPVPETAEQEAARKMPPQRVSRVAARDLNPRRTPAMQYPNVDGCGAIFVYGWSADWTEALTVTADKEALTLSTTPQTFDLANSRAENLSVAIHVYAAALEQLPFCTDIGTTLPPVEKWTARAGKVTIQLSEPGLRRATPFMYRATVTLEGLEFEGPAGARARQREPLTLSAWVGWLAG